MFILNCSDLKTKSILVCLLYLILLIYGINNTVTDLIDAEEPFGGQQLYIILAHLAFHVFILVTLCIGVIKEKSYFLVPWLCSSFLFFTVATIYSLINFSFHFLLEYIINFVSPVFGRSGTRYFYFIKIVDATTAHQK